MSRGPIAYPVCHSEAPHIQSGCSKSRTDEARTRLGALALVFTANLLRPSAALIRCFGELDVHRHPVMRGRIPGCLVRAGAFHWCRSRHPGRSAPSPRWRWRFVPAHRCRIGAGIGRDHGPWSCETGPNGPTPLPIGRRGSASSWLSPRVSSVLGRDARALTTRRQLVLVPFGAE
jgi:hypothetical protein